MPAVDRFGLRCAKGRLSPTDVRANEWHNSPTMVFNSEISHCICAISGDWLICRSCVVVKTRGTITG